MILTGVNPILKKIEKKFKSHSQHKSLLKEFNIWKDISEAMYWSDVSEVREVFPNVKQERKNLHFQEEFYLLIIAVDFQEGLFHCEDVIFK